jgi:hypothetical protein
MYSSTLSLTSVLDGVDAQRHTRPLYARKREPVPIVLEAGWAPGLVWTGAQNRPTGIRTPNHPARSDSLRRLRYPDPQVPPLFLLKDEDGPSLCNALFTDNILIRQRIGDN